MEGGGDGRTYTTDEALSRVGFGRFQALVLGLLGTGWVAEAMEIMLLSFVGLSIEAEFGVLSEEEGLITSVVFAGMIVGACLGGFGSDRYGRRVGCLFTALSVVYLVFSVPSLLTIQYCCLCALWLALGWVPAMSFPLGFWSLSQLKTEVPGLLFLLLFGALERYWRLYLLGSRSCASVGAHLKKTKDFHLYINVLVTNFAEFPGLLLAGLLVDRIGRKVSMGGLILLCCAFLQPLAIHLEEGLAITLLFCARACSAGSFAVIHAYSPEIYPTSCRNTGVGVTYSGGSMVSLLVTTALLESCRQKEVVLTMNLLLFLTGAACALFPFETKGREIQ